MLIFASSVPGQAVVCPQRHLVHNSEDNDLLIPSFTLAPSGADISTISHNFPEEHFGMTPNLFMWTNGYRDGLSGPRTLPSLHSSARYFRMTSDLWVAVLRTFLSCGAKL